MEIPELHLIGPIPKGALTLEDVKQLIEKGTEFELRVETPGGRDFVYPDLEMIEEYAKDPDAARAKWLSVTKEQFLRWIETKGRPRCNAKTKTGRRCNGVLPGYCDRKDIHDWLELDGSGKCPKHDGFEWWNRPIGGSPTMP